jgi:drug/metabolite transporter (DMT)-like permease
MLDIETEWTLNASLTTSIRAWVAVAEQGLLATASTTVLWNWGLKRVPASQAGIFVNLEPLVGTILGVSLLCEVLGRMAVAGGALIIGGAMYFSYKLRRALPHKSPRIPI